MPFLKIVTNVEPSDVVRARLLLDLSKLIGTRLGKPETYMMTGFEGAACMTFGGTTEATCYVELKNVGRFTAEVTHNLSIELCEFIESALNVPKHRVYIEFYESPAHLWGHSKGSFG